MSPVTLESQWTISKEAPLLQEVVLICWTGKCWRSVAAAQSPPLGHPLEGNSPRLLSALSACRSQAASAEQSRSGGGSPGSSVPVEVSQHFSGHRLCVAACHLPLETLSSLLFEVSQRVAIKPGLCLISR